MTRFIAGIDVGQSLDPKVICRLEVTTRQDDLNRLMAKQGQGGCPCRNGAESFNKRLPSGRLPNTNPHPLQPTVRLTQEVAIRTVALIETRAFDGWRTLECVVLVGVEVLGVGAVIFYVMVFNDPDY